MRYCIAVAFFFFSFCLLLILQHCFLWTRIVHDCLCLLSLSRPRVPRRVLIREEQGESELSPQSASLPAIPAPRISTLCAYLHLVLEALHVCARRTLTSSWGVSLVWRCCSVLCGKGSRSRSLQEVNRDKDISVFSRHPRTASHPARTAVDPALAS